MSHETRAQALLNSPVGCCLILDVFENRHLPLEYFAQPKVSFWLVASAMDFMDPYADGYGGMHQRMALKDARAHEDLALGMVSHPAFAWWWEPVDLANQVWASPRMPGGGNLKADCNPSRDPLKLFDAGSWRKPGSPLVERGLDPVPTSWQHTSTLRGGTTSEVTAFALTAADHISAFPLAVWKVDFEQDVRVREINNPIDWHELCLEFPRIAPDGRLVPDWLRAADEWDGVHLTLGGMLSCEQARYERDGEWSMLQYWHTERTHWLGRMSVTATRLPDARRSDHWQRLKRYPYDGYDPRTGEPLATG